MLHVYLYHPAWNAINARYSTVAWKQIKKMYLLSDATNAAECTYKWVISHFHPAFRLQHIWSSFEPAQKRYWPSNGELNAIISRKSLTNFDLFGVWLPHVPWRSWGEVRMNQQDMDFGIREYANLFENLVYTLISHVILRILTCCNRQMSVCASLATEHYYLWLIVPCLPIADERPSWVMMGVFEHLHEWTVDWKIISIHFMSHIWDRTHAVTLNARYFGIPMAFSTFANGRPKTAQHQRCVLEPAPKGHA